MAEQEKENKKKEESSIKLRINKHKLLHYLPYIIIAITTIIGFTLVAPLFKPGIPMNIDLPGKYERIWCFQEFEKETGIHTLPTTMCRYKNTGDAVFQAYPPLFYELINIVSKIFGLELAFKIILVFTYFLPSIGALVLFLVMKKPLEGSFAYSLLLIELGGWHKGGFEQTFNVGMSSNALASGFFILTIGLLINLLYNPTNKNFILMSLSATATFLAHGIPFVFFGLCLIIFIILYWSTFIKRWKMYILFPAIFLLLIGFWLIPFLVKWDYFGAGTTTHMDISGIRDFFWRNLNKVTFSLGIAGIVLINYIGLTQKPRYWKAYLALGICALLVPLLWLWSMYSFATYKAIFKISKFLILIRLHAELRTLLFVFAALLLGYLAIVKIRVNKTKVPIGLIMALILFSTAIIAGYPTIKSHSDSIKTSEGPDFKYMRSVFPLINDAEGRVLGQDTLYNFGVTSQGLISSAGLSHMWTTGPVFTGKEFVGALPWYYYPKYNYEYTEENRIFTKKPNEYTKEELDKLMENLNVQYIIGYHPYFREGLDKYYTIKGGLQPIVQGYFPLVVYSTNITPSFFSINPEEGEIIESEYKGLRGTYARVNADKDTRIVLKLLAYPNWKIKLDGKETKYSINDYGHLEVAVPKGEHKIEYDYVLLPVDVWSYILPVLGLILCWLVWTRRLFNKENSRHNESYE